MSPFAVTDYAKLYSNMLIKILDGSTNLSPWLPPLYTKGPDVLSLLQQFSGAHMTHSAQETCVLCSVGE